jgi:dTMP kinase
VTKNPDSRPRRGIFVSFEGSEGCGKSTQIARLAERLAAAGNEPLLTREPGGTGVGEAIRHLLQFDASGQGMSPETELLLFAASRAQLVREMIRPALDAGRIVLADRFLDSTTVYQGVARAIGPDDVATINRFAVGGAMPDVTFVFDLDRETARARLAERNRPNAPKDRMESEPEAFYEAVREGYRQLAASLPERLVLVDARMDPGEITAVLHRELEARFDGIFG